MCQHQAPSKQPTLESQTLGKLTLGWRRRRGGWRQTACQAIWDLPPPLSFFDFVCARHWFPCWKFSALPQIPAVFMDSPDLITVNEAAKTSRSKWKTSAGRGDRGWGANHVGTVQRKPQKHTTLQFKSTTISLIFSGDWSLLLLVDKLLFLQLRFEIIK